jgi:hypothetical protein
MLPRQVGSIFPPGRVTTVAHPSGPIWELSTGSTGPIEIPQTRENASGAFRPEDIGSDRLVERALRTSADYVASYVNAVAKADPERARLLAEGIEVPWVRPIERPNGHTKAVVEVVRLSEYLTNRALVIGEVAGRTGVRRLVKKKR